MNIEAIKERLPQGNKLRVSAVNPSLKRDAESVAGGLYSMNAPHAIGYLFNPTIDGKKVVTGMFCDYPQEIESGSWTYFLDYGTKRYYEIIEA